MCCCVVILGEEIKTFYMVYRIFRLEHAQTARTVKNSIMPFCGSYYYISCFVSKDQLRGECPRTDRQTLHQSCGISFFPFIEEIERRWRQKGILGPFTRMWWRENGFCFCSSQPTRETIHKTCTSSEYQVIIRAMSACIAVIGWKQLYIKRSKKFVDTAEIFRLGLV